MSTIEIGGIVYNTWEIDGYIFIDYIWSPLK